MNHWSKALAVLFLTVTIGLSASAEPGQTLHLNKKLIADAYAIKETINLCVGSRSTATFDGQGRQFAEDEIRPDSLSEQVKAQLPLAHQATQPSGQGGVGTYFFEVQGLNKVTVHIPTVFSHSVWDDDSILSGFNTVFNIHTPFRAGSYSNFKGPHRLQVRTFDCDDKSCDSGNTLFRDYTQFYTGPSLPEITWVAAKSVVRKKRDENRKKKKYISVPFAKQISIKVPTGGVVELLPKDPNNPRTLLIDYDAYANCLYEELNQRLIEKKDENLHFNEANAKYFKSFARFIGDALDMAAGEIFRAFL